MGRKELVVGLGCALVVLHICSETVFLKRDFASVITDQNSPIETRDRKANVSSHQSMASGAIDFETAHDNDICRMTQTKSTHGLWKDMLPVVLNQSKLPQDPKYQLHDMTAHILQILTPRLPHGVKELPRTPQLKRVLTKLQSRLDYVTNRTQIEAPPLNIVVFGGSVTAGVECWTKVNRWLKYGNCAWPARLKALLNNQYDLVRVTVQAVGGTNSETGMYMLRYGMVETKPDIIINAYATNDMHVLTMAAAKTNGHTLRDETHRIAQGFIREALSVCPEEQPLVLFLDDYLGNEQREIMATTQLNQAWHVLSTYYGAGMMSYADVVRDLVYGDTKETTFTSKGWYPGGGPEMKREIHPGVAAHMSMGFTIAYYLLELTSFACTMDWQANTTYFGGKGLPESVSDSTLNLIRYPRPPPRHLPPPLLTNLSLASVSEDWLQSDALPACRGNAKSRCPVSWVSGMVLSKDVKRIEEYLSPYIIEHGNWTINVQKKGKEGYEPDGNGTMVWDFDLNQTVSTLSLFYMKSYGDNWENSLMRVSLIDKNISTEITTLSGFHDKETSEMYTEEIALNATSRLRMAMDLVGGTTFKLMGITVCL